MRKGWKEVKLGEVADLSTGFPFKGDKYEHTGTLRVVRGENITEGYLRWDSEKFWNYDTESLEKYFLRGEDIVIGMDGSKVGKNRSRILDRDLPIILAQRVACVRAKSNICQRFLWLNIHSDSFQNYIESIHTGTSIPHISLAQLADFEIPLPPLPEQEAIAEVLSSLDDKIDLLHRQNKTLEAMAGVVFEEMLTNTEISPFFDAFTLIGGGTPSTKSPAYWDGDIPWLSAADISSSSSPFVFEGERSITSLGIQNSSAKLLPQHSTVITARGTVGKVCLTGIAMSFSQSCYGVKCEIADAPFLTFHLTKRSIDELKAAAYGSVFDTITTRTFEGISVPFADPRLYESLEKDLSTYYKKILANTLQIRTLTQTRDLLLPRLLRGEVSVL